MDRDTALRLKQMLWRYQQELMHTTDAHSQEALNKLLEDASCQLAKHGTQHPSAGILTSVSKQRP